jgi:hypothetical protein
MRPCDLCGEPAERKPGRRRCAACRPVLNAKERSCTQCGVTHVSHRPWCADCQAEWVRLYYRKVNGISLSAGPASSCLECGGELLPADNHRKVTMIRQYCSSVCRNRAKCRRRRVTRAGLPTDRYAAADIFKRDEWTCQLCGDGIDRRVKWPDPWSASIDHVVPVSMGGADVVSNVQAAHLRCNVVKGGVNRVAA